MRFRLQLVKHTPSALKTLTDGYRRENKRPLHERLQLHGSATTEAAVGAPLGNCRTPADILLREMGLFLLARF